MNALKMSASMLVLSSALVAGQAWAQVGCAGTLVAASELSGKTVCGVKDSERWQEYHAPSGDLIDYKRGSDPVDPTMKVGTWSANANSVTYTYDKWSPAESFTYPVYKIDDTKYCLEGSDIDEVTAFTGQGPCP